MPRMNGECVVNNNRFSLSGAVLWLARVVYTWWRTVARMRRCFHSMWWSQSRCKDAVCLHTHLQNLSPDYLIWPSFSFSLFFGFQSKHLAPKSMTSTSGTHTGSCAVIGFWFVSPELFVCSYWVIEWRSGDDRLRNKSVRAHKWVWTRKSGESLWTHNAPPEPAVRKITIEKNME